MSPVTIKVYQSRDEHRELVKTLHIDSDSHKALNGARALKILRHAFPELGYSHSLTKTDEGWYHTQALEPKENCPFHYVWQHFYVSHDA